MLASTQNKKDYIKKAAQTLMLVLCLGLSQAVFAAAPPGTTTAPYTLSYSAKLTTSTGTPVTTTQNVRFSIWSDADSDATDYLANGSINTSATGYTGWQETHTITPDANGLFHVKLGTTNTLPNFSASTQTFLEVDIKDSLLADTAYEVLDPDGVTTNTTDRQTITSSAYAINADTVDNHDTGTSAGSIPVLDSNSHLAIGTMPSGTNADTFVLDADNTIGAPSTAPSTVKLQFGTTLGKTLEYVPASTWFNFNDDVNVTGNLTVTGTINGATVSTSTVGAYNQSLVYDPEYKNMVMQGDGTANNGKLEIFFADTDGTGGNSNFNFYKWTTYQASLQDMDLILRVTLPNGFTSFQSTPIQFTYHTENGNTANNKIDVSVEDTNGTAVSLTGGSSLASAEWTTADITFNGSPTFTAGQAITIKIKQSALTGGAAYSGKLSINYTGR
jgi:hypothetical protein